MSWQLIRDIFLFFGGLAGVAYETIGQSTDRPTLLILFAAMMGLPAFLQSEAPRFEKKKPTHKKHKHRDQESEEDDYGQDDE